MKKHIKRLQKGLAFTTLALGMTMTSTTASALVIKLNNLNNVTPGTDAFYGFSQAARFWEMALTNNVTVNLNVGFSALAPGVLGSTGSTTNGVFLQPFVQQLQSQGNSALDAIATANAQSFKPSVDGVGAGAYDALISGPKANGTGVQTAGGLTTRLDNDGSRNNNSLSANTSVLKAIGVTPVYTGANIANSTDGTVQFSSSFGFDFDPTNGIDANKFDFIGVAIHEIGHALGFRSGVDVYDGNTNFGGNLNAFTFMTPLDLFRYSADSAALGVNDWQIGGSPYFSITRGLSNYNGNAFFSTGRNFGDGQQASHWKDSAAGVTQLGIMDPTSGRGQQMIIDSLDLAAMDAIGWNIRYDVMAAPNRAFSTRDIPSLTVEALAVPEPAGLALVLAALGVCVGVTRGTRKTLQSAH
jgi:hypothetical protein